MKVIQLTDEQFLQVQSLAWECISRNLSGASVLAAAVDHSQKRYKVVLTRTLELEADFIFTAPDDAAAERRVEDVRKLYVDELSWQRSATPSPAKVAMLSELPHERGPIRGQ